MSSKKINVLIFPAEGSNAIELHDALSSCVNVKVYGATSVERHGKYIFENYISGLPLISDKNFINAFNELIHRYSIDVIFPTHDTVVLFFAQNKALIKSIILGGDLYTATVCRSKIKTYELFSDCSFVPTRYVVQQKEDIVFPLFIKPDDGQGAVGARKIETEQEFETIDFDKYLVTEFLPGEEYTVDCFTDKDKKLRYVSPRSRERVMAGISVAGKNVECSDEIWEMAKIINERLNFLGLWYFQIKKGKDGRFKLMEISARCAGTMCLTRAKGINLPLLSVYAACGQEVTIFDNSYQVQMDRALVGRYFIDYEYDIVYLDFDDTITLNGKVNLNVIRFIYQCHNKGKQLVLLTRHEKNIQETLHAFAISNLLFSKIVVVGDNEMKVDYIGTTAKAVFIDNSYKERYDVAQKCKMPVFDVDGVEFLLDWRY